MFKLFREFKAGIWLIVLIVMMVAGQAIAELYLPQKMSEIIDDGIYVDYEPLYEYEDMDKPSGISGVDSEKTLKGYDKDKIPVFEMVDGFSTYDLKDVLEKQENTSLSVNFRDIPVSDSRELFDKVITPFLDGLKVYQKPGANFYDYSSEDQEAIRRVINTFMVFEEGDPRSILPASNKEKDISVNGLLDRDPNADEDATENKDNKKILTACISCMKKSQYGNIMPVPVDRNGNRIPTDTMGQALDKSKLIYKYSNKDGDPVRTVKESYTKRPDPMPDYEVIITNGVLGFAYKYNGEKWIDHSRGDTKLNAQIKADKYNANLLVDVLINRNSKKFTKEEMDQLSTQIRTMMIHYHDENDLILLERLFTFKNKSAKQIKKAIQNTYKQLDNGDVRTIVKESKWQQFWIKIRNYITLSPTSLEKDKGLVFELVSAEEMLLPDGNKIQTKSLYFMLTRGGMMILLTVAACTAAILATVCSSRYASSFSAYVRSRVFRKVQTFSLAEFDHFSNASLITRSTNDINQMQEIVLLIMRTGLIAPITLIGGFIMSAEKSLRMTSVLLYDIPILFIASFIAAKVVQPLFKIIQQRVDRLTLVTREGLTGVRVVRAFNKQQSENEKFAEVNASLTKTATTISKYNAVLAPLIAVCMNLSIVGIVWIASKEIAYDKDIKVGDMMAVIQYMTQIMLALVMLATVFVMFPRGSVSAARVNEVLGTQIKLKDPEHPCENISLEGVVEFKNVSFKYSDEAEYNILEDISFIAEKGKTTAIVGGTGSGKSTVINLIPRFYDISVGEILVDGVNIKDMSQSDLRARIGFVPQKSVLFSGSIKDNLLWGKADATEEEIWEALDIAQCSNFVKGKEFGIDTKLEQGGVNCSGGQKQRLSIARAIIRKPEILIFDDSFSALDFKTDKNLRKALKTITKNTATIIVAQRIGTIMDADTIIVLDAGKIVGMGKHSDLICDCQVYRDIALSQISAAELGIEE